MTFTFTDDNASPNLVTENAASGVTVGVTAAAVNDIFEPFEAVTEDTSHFSMLTIQPRKQHTFRC